MSCTYLSLFLFFLKNIFMLLKSTICIQSLHVVLLLEFLFLLMIGIDFFYCNLSPFLGLNLICKCIAKVVFLPCFFYCQISIKQIPLNSVSLDMFVCCDCDENTNWTDFDSIQISICLNEWPSKY